MNKKSNSKEWLDEYYDDDDYNIDFSKELNDIYYNNTIKKLSDIYSSLREQDIAKEKEDVKGESIDEAAERLKLDTEVIHSFTENAQEDRNLKKKYAIILVWLLFIQVIFFNSVFILCGLGILNYSEKILEIYIGGGLIEIVSLVSIIVKYLFQDNISVSLNNILEKNKKDK